MMLLNKNNIIIKVILTIVILTLILTGLEHLFINKKYNNYAVKVNGQKIDYDQLEKIYFNEKNRQIQVLGNQFFIENKQYASQLYKTIVDQVINEVLLEQYLKKINLKIDDENIKKIIFSQSAFQIDGKFNNDKYLNIINSLGFTVGQYADEIHKKLAVQKFLKIISNTEFTLENELKSLCELLSQQRLTDMLKIKLSSYFDKQEVNDKEINEYYSKNNHLFTKKDQFLIEYIKIDKKDIKKEQVSEDEIKNWYKQHQIDFTKKQINHYKIIQTKTEKDAKELLNQLKTGITFSNVIKSKLVDPFVSSKNGDLGWLDSSSLPEELKQASYLDKKNQFSEIINSSVGFIIVYLEDIKPSYIQPLSEVKNKIFNKIQEDKRTNSFNKLNKKLIDQFNKHEDTFIKYQKIYELKKAKTDWFDSDNFPEEINSPLIKEKLFKTIENIKKIKIIKNNDKTFIINMKDNCTFLIYIKDHKPKYLKKINEVQQKIIDSIKFDKSKETAKKQAHKILLDLKSGKKYDFEEKKVFTRVDQDEITKEVFKMPKPKNNKFSYSIIEDQNGNMIILSLVKVYSTPLSNQEKKSISNNITQNNINYTLLSLMKDLKKTAKIKYGKILSEKN